MKIIYTFLQYDELYQVPRIKINWSEMYSEASGMEAVLGLKRVSKKKL